ncbi:Asp23/Gls24 family envelope stress response protein [Egicoccus sp. AB-alg2]|uniref:Asp23/Gls24 family envelope stress response protein n=1 Tax=Egicoccus sp. AB-alg2 TaxID=3242693 RepID=UPI00359D0F95
MSNETAPPRRVAIARAAVEAAQATPGVARLDGGALGEFATYADGEPVEGVRVVLEAPITVRLRLVATYGYELPALASAVSRAVRERVGPADEPLRIDIRFVDLESGEPAGRGNGSPERS